MIQPRFEPIIAERLTPQSRVLDVGGARDPFRLATHMLDVVSHDEARQTWGEDFTGHAPPADRWTVHDICSGDPFPFPDKFFDFVICSHTLEDVRDPIRACRELSRIAKAGYIETPSPLIELTRGVDRAGRGWVGYAHHRWLVDVNQGGLVFVFKPHCLAASRRFHFPPRFAKQWSRPGQAQTCLLWDGELRAEERVFVDRDALEAEIERIVRLAGGENLSMRWAALRERAFRLGREVADTFGMRPALRPWVARFQRLR